MISKGGGGRVREVKEEKRGTVVEEGRMVGETGTGEGNLERVGEGGRTGEERWERGLTGVEQWERFGDEVKEVRGLENNEIASEVSSSRLFSGGGGQGN